MLVALSMQRELTTPGDLLTDDGELVQCGWARRLLLRYDRARIGVRRTRIKEWDYYCCLSPANEHGIAVTVADLGYLGLVSVTHFDLSVPRERTNQITTLFPLGGFNLPVSSTNGDVHFEHKRGTVHIEHEGDARLLRVDLCAFADDRDLVCDLRLVQPVGMDSMVIVTPFANRPHAFYYNEKINCLVTSGAVRLGDTEYRFDPATDRSVLDWGRGVWPYRNTWYWASASGAVGGVPFGFNLGYGFGDTRAATENMLFYDHEAHKLEDVRFEIPVDDYLEEWRIRSGDGRLELLFRPILDRYESTNLVLVKTVQHQVFGHFDGSAILDDGTELFVDGLLGFAEKVYNRW